MKSFKRMLYLCTLGIILLGMNSPAFADKPVTTIGKYLCINYKPFFPIGLYSFPDRRKDDAMWKEAADAGFNFVLSEESGKHGIYVARAIPWKTIDSVRVSLMETYRDNSLVDDLKIFLAKNENDTTILCWHAPDEPGWYGPSGVSLRLGYEAIKANSKKPVWLNNGPYLAPNIVNFSRPVEMTRPCDILSEDIYPIPEGKGKPSQGDNIFAYYVGEDTKMLVDMCSIGGVQETPVWMVLQGFNWGDLGGTNPRFKDFLPPTMHELRYMTYDAIVHGATGILWWGVRNTKTDLNARLWNDLKAMASELRKYYSLWTCPFELVPEKLSISVQGMHRNENPVHYLIKLTGNKVYILAVNTRNAPLDNVRFSVAGDRGVLTKVKVLTEGRDLPVLENTSWTDQFEGYGVHIYETDIYFSFMKRYYKDPLAVKADPAKK
jgi:hypothetical protein